MLAKVLHLLSILLFVTIGTSLSAQISDSRDLTGLFSSPDTDIMFSDTDNGNVYYLDLEKMEGQPLDAIVMENARIVEKMSLMDIKRDAFYELNLDDLEKGDYKIRIRTFKREYQFEINVK